MPDQNRWRSQIADTIRDVESLADRIQISPDEKRGIHAAEQEFRWHITPYYAGIMDPDDRNCPIRLQAVPQEVELDDPHGMIDPLLEEDHNPAPNVIKVYPDRIAWTVANTCPVLCRHCLRKRMVGRERFDFSEQAKNAAVDYIARTPEIRDVLVTGGDPLMYSDELVDDILSRVRRIPHVKIVRIGTRTPCTMPQRITSRLCGILKKHHPLYVNTQFNHPKELTPEAHEACARLSEAGIPLGNQSVLLAGINDDLEVMMNLVRGLLEMRVRPYYLYQAQLLSGTAHFRTPIEVGIRIVEGLRGRTSGMAIPTYVLDTPYGKIPMHPNTIERRDDDAVYLKSWDGKVWREPNPREPTGKPEQEG